MRKRNPTKFYFDKKEEEAIEEYQKAKTQAEREEIFNTKLYVPMRKLAECVLHSHNFPYIISSIGDENAITEGTSQLSTIITKYDKKRGRCFSFFSYCLKNYYIQWNQRCYEDVLKLISLDHVKDNEDNDDTSHKVPKINLQVEPDPQHSDFDLKEFLALSADWWEKKKNFVCKKKREHAILDVLIKLFRAPESIDFRPNSHGYGKKETMKYLSKELNLTPAQFRVFMLKIKPVQEKLMQEYLISRTVSLPSD